MHDVTSGFKSQRYNVEAFIVLGCHECFEDRFIVVFLTDTTLSNMAAQPGCVSQTDVHKACHGTLDCNKFACFS